MDSRPPVLTGFLSQPHWRLTGRGSSSELAQRGAGGAAEGAGTRVDLVVFVSLCVECVSAVQGLR
jgi:hypothetical protein